MRTIRTRFQYPSADIVTKNPAFDRTLDRAIRQISRRKSPFPTSHHLSSFDVAVLGYPRSGNTFLIGWLQYVTAEQLRVLDGRLTHSAIDLMTMDRAGLSTLIPARNPVDTVASLMVRANQHQSAAFARDALRSFEAWYAVAGKLLGRPTISVVSFETISTDLRPVASMFSSTAVLADRANAGNEPAKAWLEEKVKNEAGQGLALEGVPASQMVSLPRQERRHMNDDAKEILAHADLSAELTSAEETFENFMVRSRALSKCL